MNEQDADLVRTDPANVGGKPQSLRDRALTTLRGMTDAAGGTAEDRRRQEAMAQLVLNLTPNLVVMVDNDLRIVSLSPSAERALDCHLEEVRGRPLSDILTFLDDFQRARQYQRPVARSKVCYRPDLIVEQTVVPAAEEGVLVAIMRDITAEERQREELNGLMQETIARTQEVIDFQMQVAHEIASLLGETTAKSKIQLGRLIELVKGLEGPEIP